MRPLVNIKGAAFQSLISGGSSSSSHWRQAALTCRICACRFQSKSDLIKHKRHSHLLVSKDYVCNFCGKRFSQQQNLALHVRMHTGEKPYVCSFCRKEFSDYSNCMKHLKQHHNATDNLNLQIIRRKFCQICRQHFDTDSQLQLHRCVLFHSQHNGFLAEHSFSNGHQNTAAISGDDVIIVNDDEEEGDDGLSPEMLCAADTTVGSAASYDETLAPATSSMLTENGTMLLGNGYNILGGGADGMIDGCCDGDENDDGMFSSEQVSEVLFKIEPPSHPSTSTSAAAASSSSSSSHCCTVISESKRGDENLHMLINMTATAPPAVDERRYSSSAGGGGGVGGGGGCDCSLERLERRLEEKFELVLSELASLKEQQSRQRWCLMLERSDQ